MFACRSMLQVKHIVLAPKDKDSQKYSIGAPFLKP